ncbi:SDR family oxidoreductase [Noviherbaspirillum sp. L7-7A]|uniref:SDR family oxidoreductase n=1 Tax=Noviherbaspirillum sp. L7-7A TaxID=2850560 RepID=UPI001C2C9018|nr:SDR family oxidoreductase [Noviherbaspirillum sp. L7-7A]MBV0881266.1 SDR family oxidoreductase [Noviherbaspirillum sp. L7-7A]
MNNSQHPEVVVITGASAGIGRATVREFARHGASIALLARDADRLEAACAEARGLGAKAITIPTDVADPDQVEAAAARVEEALGPIDIWINNAMATIFAPLSKISPEDYRRVTDVTYHGYVWGTMAALKRMRQRKRGTIVQVGSALAYRSIPLQSAYCGAKHAIKGFTESLRTELMHEGSGIHLTMLEMPGVNTPQFEWCKTTLRKHPRPMGLYYQPEVAARAIYWAAHARRRELVVGGPSAMTILAEKLVPGLMDRYLARTGFRGQHTDEPVAADRAANLWDPVPGPYEARGAYSAGAHDHSIQLWASMHRKWLLAGSLALGLLWRARSHGEERRSKEDTGRRRLS